MAHVHLLLHLLPALYHGQVVHQRAPLLVRELHRLLVRDPQVYAAPAGVDPEEVMVAELLADGLVEDIHGDGDEVPAAVADVGAGAAGADLVVVGHVDIEDELAQLGDEVGCADGLAVSWLRGPC